MAVSKTQNERPAIIALIDQGNDLEVASDAHAQNIETLTEGLADEIGDREQADTNLGARIDAEIRQRESGDDALGAIIGEGFTAQNTVANSLSATNQQVLALTQDVDDIEQVQIPGIQSFLNRFRLGATEQITVPAADVYASSLVYQTPFEATDLTFVVLGFADDLPLTDLSINLIDSTYSGFSYSVANTGSDPVDVRIGFLAVKVS